MKIGVVISTNEPEAVWNAFRFGNTALNSNHEVKIFLINRGVELEDIGNEKYDVKEQTRAFLQDNGRILACGTCIRSRQREGSSVCPISTMKDLVKLVEECDKVLTFC